MIPLCSLAVVVCSGSVLSKPLLKRGLVATTNLPHVDQDESQK
jgi:hypothetical protein